MKLKTILVLALAAALMLTGCHKASAEDENTQGSGAGETVVETAGEEAAEPEEPALPMMETSLDDYPLSTPTDDILVLVNKTHPVTRDYVAPDLVTVASCDNSVGNADTKKMRKVAADAIEELIAGAKDAGYNIVMRTGYRSYDYQQNVWNTTAEQSGEDYARAYVATPGYSEHHTGLAVDIGIFYSDGSQGSFSESQNAVWMDEHSSEYGFIRRYAEDKVSITGISNEKWHFRYVGLPHAVYMKQNNLCLEEYLEYLRTQTGAGNPLTVSTSEGTYSVWYTTETSIPKPSGDYRVSGDNIAGYIITVRE